MKNNRRDFIKKAGLAGLSFAGGSLFGNMALAQNSDQKGKGNTLPMNASMDIGDETLIGAYGDWAASLIEGKIPSHSLRGDQWSDVDEWKKAAKERYADRIAVPDIGPTPAVTVDKQHTYDGLHIEEISWQLPYGPRSEGILLKPEGATGQLPGVLAFHDHGGKKYFGKRKITRTSDERHPLIEEHQAHYYEDVAWANELAKRGYVVLVPDAFPFASRRVLLKDVPEYLRDGLTDDDPENPDNIEAYNDWAASHESVMARSLFSAGTTWPGVFFAEDQQALNILAEREDVDANRLGCGGLSGGGMRTVFMAGMDSRIKSSVCMGFMTTWKDLVVDKSFTHTWMTYVPILPNELDFPEILGLNLPNATFVQNCNEDGLYTLSEMHVADDILQEVYDKAGVSDKYKCTFYPGGHKFDKPMQKDAFAWFNDTLKV